MKDLLKAGCEVFADNKEIIREFFKWDYEIMSVAGSIIVTGAGQVADLERLKECKKILKKYEGAFSVFRSEMEIPVICKMSVVEDPIDYLTAISGIYNKLHKGKIFDSQYMVLAAICIHDAHVDDRVDEIVEKTKRLLKLMEGKHPFLTSDEDMALAALLAMTGKSDESIISETEECYAIMKKKFRGSSNAVQSLSHVLTVEEGGALSKCEKVNAIYEALLRKKIKFGTDHELASLGALVSINTTAEEIANDIVDAAEYLEHRKGFGDWSIGKKMRLLFAALIVAQAYAKDNPDTTALGSTVALIIAEEITVMMITMSCTVACSTSH